MLIKSIQSASNIQPAFGTHLINPEYNKKEFALLTSDEFKKGFGQAREELEKDGNNDATLELSLSKMFSYAVYKKKKLGITLFIDPEGVNTLNTAGKAGDVKEFLVNLCKTAKSEFDNFLKVNNPIKTDKK
ncbi:MAG: hypothetical protein ACD_20C00098G0003 [uncultured bacterium]|nr:MAG: hypothetical protein ACD_20C00098G0003 [uncultured bacterium]HBH18814.1 hypothetical protein [Cyanobacteria bacterium UBA9579]